MSEVRQKEQGEAIEKLAETVPTLAARGRVYGPPELESPIPLPLVFTGLLLARSIAAVYATIPDCDEVYNYWEPTHYLTHNSGFQTWEYSPVYMIRSWAYIALHSIFSELGGRVLRQLGESGIAPNLFQGKSAEFYALRLLFAFACAYSEYKLFNAIRVHISRNSAAWYWFASLGSAGMFHASVAFLPSSFAMYTGTLGAAHWISGNSTASMIWFATGAILGWPFAAALAIPFIISDFAKLSQGSILQPGTVARRTLIGLFKALLGVVGIGLIVVGVDSLAYGKLSVVPWKIVMYNVFGGEGKGPDIYGTEPWWFYLANLVLNFNLLLPLSLASILFVPASFLLKVPPLSKKALTVMLPFFLWLAIFTSQPHKEERFMFPAYPFLLTNAALTLSAFFSVLPVFPFSAPTYLALFASTVISGSRILHIITAFSAPLHLPSSYPEVLHPTTLCIGKEWYRFPSSYLFPALVTPQFIASSFRGLLPGHFRPDENRTGIRDIPMGMNDRNEYDPGKVVDISVCDYLIDLNLPTQDVSNAEEPVYSKSPEWESVKCEKWMDVHHASWKVWERRFWVPGRTRNAEGWGDYCLLKRVIREEKDGYIYGKEEAVVYPVEE